MFKARWLVVLALTAAPQAHGQTTTKEQDARIRRAVTQVVNAGAEMYNTGDQIGCLRLYQGALLSLEPMLDQRPDLQKAMRDGLGFATGTADIPRRAFAMRKILDMTLAAVSPPLWDRLGGEAAVRAVVHDLILVLAQDPKVDVTRGGKFKLDDPATLTKLEQYFVEFVSSATGGPLKYTGREMRIAHAGMMITDAQFDASAAALIAVLRKYRMPQREIDELIGLIAKTKKDIVMAPALRPLYERLGGEPAITAVVEDFVGRAAADPKVNFTRKGTPGEWSATPENLALLKKGVVDFIGVATGGPQKYAGRDMKTVHQGMMITDAEFDALAADLKASLNKFRVGPNEQFELLRIVSGTRREIVEKK